VSVNESFERFQADVTRYIETHGSWEVAREVESFSQFHERTRWRNPPPRHVPAFRAPRDLAVPPSPGPLQDAIAKPPFQFLLLDPVGNVLMGPKPYRVGTQVTRSVRRRGMPIAIDGEVAALAVPISRPNLNGFDRAYLASVRDSLLYGGLVAALIAAIWGIWVGRRLTQPLAEMTRAIQAMSEGNLRQQVVVRTRDELGILAESFNRMSVELANTYEELKTSHQTISEQAAQLHELSVRDELTQLYNRRYFNIQAAALYASAQRYERPLCFAIADIDHFKRINDTFSHAVGDRVLQQVAQILKANARDSDITARYGGEEFVTVFPETTLEGATAYCERLRATIAHYPWYDIHPDLYVTTSIGLNAEVELGGYEQMLAAADCKLYEAKHSGRNRVCV
ncbi:MAG: diguanylate cyclase, partial [Cyanobacteria bacterium J06642_2]